MKWSVLSILLLASCGTDDQLEDYPELLAATCWTENGAYGVFWFVPEGEEVDEELDRLCIEIGEDHLKAELERAAQ